MRSSIASISLYRWGRDPEPQPVVCVQIKTTYETKVVWLPMVFSVALEKIYVRQELGLLTGLLCPASGLSASISKCRNGCLPNVLISGHSQAMWPMPVQFHQRTTTSPFVRHIDYRPRHHKRWSYSRLWDRVALQDLHRRDRSLVRWWRTRSSSLPRREGTKSLLTQCLKANTRYKVVFGRSCPAYRYFEQTRLIDG